MAEKWMSKCTVDHKWYCSWLLIQLYYMELWFGSICPSFCHWRVWPSFCVDPSQELVNTTDFSLDLCCPFVLSSAIETFVHRNLYETLPEVTIFILHLLWADLSDCHLKYICFVVFYNLESVDHVIKSSHHETGVILFRKVSFVCLILCWHFSVKNCMIPQ